MKKSILDLKNRHILYQTILKYPGIHLRELMRKVNVSNSTVRYHINYLLKRNLIYSKADNGYVRYFIKDSVCNLDKEMMAVLRMKIPRYIILNLLFHKASSRIKLAEDLDTSPSVIGYYLKRLEELNLIKKAKVENGVVFVNHREVKFKEYEITTREIVYILYDYNLINDFFIVNRNWFSDAITVDLINYSIELESVKFPKRKMSSFEKQLDEIIDIFYDVFPNPFKV